MATSAQAAAATAGAGSLAAAGAYGITQAVKGSEGEETTEDSSTNNSDPTPITFKPSDLSNYANKFLSLTREENLQYLVKPDNNDEWWKLAYKNKYENRPSETKLDNLFRDLNSYEKLKEACKNAYSQNKDSYKFGDEDYLIDNISSFCTKGNNKQDVSEPKAEVYNTPQTSSDYQNGVLSVAKNAKVLVKKEQGTNNDLWWKWAFKKLYKTNNSDLPTIFQTTTVTNDFDATASNTLNHACNEAYKTPYVELEKDSNKLLKNIQKFCSTNRTLELTLPEPATHKSIKEAASTGSYSSGVAKQEANQTKLIDPDSTDNNNWWDWAYTTQYLTKEESYPLDDLFKALVKGKANGDQSSDKSLAKACKDAYSKTKNDLQQESNRLLNNIQRFCTRNNQTLDISNVS